MCLPDISSPPCASWPGGRHCAEDLARILSVHRCPVSPTAATSFDARRGPECIRRAMRRALTIALAPA
jgi:hypothetical protein